MVGLNSVYPDGIHFRRVKLGPFERSIVEAQPKMAARIEAADNRATRVFGQLLSDLGVLDYGDFAGLPDDEPTSDDTAFAGHYASLRGSDAFSPNPVPFIPDRVVKGPYLELFVPYRARQAAAAMRLACPLQMPRIPKERDVGPVKLQRIPFWK